ncbi:sensor histidine kinase [Streptacidiphilus fuscans]|uniref:Histidine kinase n=1 Tax=Streptacidiphilus fuscans TaxID=2789292 RepID=A0A931B5T7_9ACTN|nr:histidine kinase [Streptacidiphilus fuscans]MBF9068408.1 histidine kinase [Streptacidiphilus fuscans]
MGLANFAPRTAQVITGVVIVGFFLIALSYAVSNRLSAIGLLGFVAILSVLLALQTIHSFPAIAPRLAPYRRESLALQGVLTYVPFFFYGDAWLGMPGFLASSALLVLPAAAGWTVFGLVVAAAAPVQLLVGYPVGDMLYNIVAVALTAAIVTGLSRMSDLVSELQLARIELARVAVMQERLRFARDLHDLLGYSISTVTLKCEFAHRIVTSQPDRAQHELEEILQISRQALSDVRTLASNYRSKTVLPEALAVQSMLSSVGIDAEVDIPDGLQLPNEVDATLVAVLREGVTNMLRHSKAGHCRIALRLTPPMVTLTLWNDGASALPVIPHGHGHGHGHGSGAHVSDSGSGAPGGSGIVNLTQRLVELGGSLSAGTADDGYLLRAVVQLPAEPADPASDADADTDSDSTPSSADLAVC